jgi:predicted enzyme related to lactoylglutathione lyase
MPVADLGSQALITDPAGAPLGVWQPGTHEGFRTLEEPGAPSWFELHTRDFSKAIAFYRAVFGWETYAASDTDELRYTMMRDPGGGGDLAGIMDAARFLPPDAPAAWSTYWYVENIDAAASTVTALGGSIIQAPETTPYGRLATATDHAGAQFKLRAPTA